MLLQIMLRLVSLIFLIRKVDVIVIDNKKNNNNFLTPTSDSDVKNLLE
jgi:hypothetical protein